MLAVVFPSSPLSMQGEARRPADGVEGDAAAVCVWERRGVGGGGRRVALVAWSKSIGFRAGCVGGRPRARGEPWTLVSGKDHAHSI
jgi:hypothetical protein